jgi:MoaA/NifB/PqqE/SkfB family radical SAM enzyme
MNIRKVPYNVKIKFASVVGIKNRLFRSFKTKPRIYEAGYKPLPTDLINQFNQTRVFGPRPLLCYAPFKMMYFAFNGEVIACCHNRKNILGNYPASSIHQIWFDGKYKVLRDHIKNDDLTFGCNVCESQLRAYNFEGAKNKLYDRYSTGKNEYPIYMEFELDNICNLSCMMCSELFSSSISHGVRKTKGNPYTNAFADELDEFIPYLKEAKFYGGEPFLIDIYYKIWERMLKLNPSINILIQTNGTILNQKIKNILEQGHFSINVSIDAIDRQKYLAIRQNSDYENVMANIEYFNKYCKHHGTHFGIIPTPMRINWDQLPFLIKFANQLEAPVYFNTLITPLEYALWNLHPEELTKIIDNLSCENFQQNNAIEKNNKKHFDSFLKQLHSWRTSNSNSPNKKTVIQKQQIEAAKTNFYSKLNLNLAAGKQELLTNVSRRIIQLFSDDPFYESVYLILDEIPVEEVIKELDTMDEEKLKQIVAKKIFEAKARYSF